MSLVRLADWIVADIVHSARARRQRERRRMMELLDVAQKQIDGVDKFEVVVLDLVKKEKDNVSLVVAINKVDKPGVDVVGSFEPDSNSAHLTIFRNTETG